MNVKGKGLRAAMALSLVWGAAVPAQAGVPVAGAAGDGQGAGMLPDRLLQCRLGRIVNFDPYHDQSAADLRFEGMHGFTLFLPGIAVRTALPPDPAEPPEPVDPRTRIVADPDGIAAQAGPGFVRAVDYWPERVELAGAVAGDMLNAIVVSGFDARTGTASLFMTHANELSHFDQDHLYQGTCSVRVGASARAGARARS